MGNAQTDTVYVWNPLAADAEGNQENYNMFTLAQNARVGGIVLAHSMEGRNYIMLSSITGTDQISTIDLEGHLTPPTYAFVDTDINDWLNQEPILRGSVTTVTPAVPRFPLGTFVGGRTISLSPYEIAGSGANIGKLVKK
jgi:hypothetical protein